MRNKILVVLSLLVLSMPAGVLFFNAARRLSVWNIVDSTGGHLTTSSGKNALLSSRLDFAIWLSHVVAVECDGVPDANDIIEVAWNSPMIEGIWLDHCNIGERPLDSLPLSRSFRSLSLRGNPITDDDVWEICRAAPNLQVLGIQDTQVTDASKKSIGSLVKLGGLHLSRTRVSDELMAELGSLTALDVLDVCGTEITSNAFESIPKSVSLLSVSDTRVDDSCAKAMPLFEHLKCIDVSGCNVSDAVIVALSKCDRLHTIVACRTQVNGAGFRMFGQHNKVDTLYLDGCNLTSDGLVSILESLPTLATLSLVKCELGSLKIRISHVSNLARVDLSGANVSADVITALASSKRLTVLNLSGATLDTEALQAVLDLPARVRVEGKILD